MYDLPTRVEQAVLGHRLLAPDQKFLVAVSGGLDSTVLLDVLHQLSAAHRWRLIVAHYNHGLRGRSADSDERFVQALALSRGLQCLSERGDVGHVARQRGISIEMAAREMRHDFLARAAREHRIKTIVLAHHGDDLVELYFLRVLRGAGPEGMSGTKWVSPSPADHTITLVRPLLDFSKVELRLYAAQQRLKYREDATNASRNLFRNRVRHQLIPLLTKQFQPALRRIIFRQREILEAETDYLAIEARRWLNKPRGAFDKLHPALQRKILQLQLFQLNIEPSFDCLEQLRLDPGNPVTLNPRQVLVREPLGRLQVREVSSVQFNPARYPVDVRGRTGRVHFGGLTIAWTIQSIRPGCVRIPKGKPGEEIFDADKIGPDIVLRHWQPGDRFQPIGMSSSVKLQDLFCNARIPKAVRRELSVAMTTAGELFWVESLRVSECYKLDKSSVRALKWVWRRVSCESFADKARP